MKQDEFKTILQQLPISPNEAAFLLASLRLGPQTIHTVGAKAGLDRSSSYYVAGELVKKGLLKEDLKQGVKRVYAAPPEILVKKLEQEITNQREKIKNLEEARMQLQQALPLLQASYHKEGAGSRLTYYEGQEGLEQIMEDILGAAQEEILLYTNQEKETDIFTGKAHERFVRARIKRGVRIRVLAVDSPRAREMRKEDARLNRETRFLPRALFFTAETYLYGNKVAMIGYKGNIFGFIVESEEFMQAQKALFEEMWQRGAEESAERFKEAQTVSPPLPKAKRRGKRLRIGVFFGGRSHEREVSLNSGRNVYYEIDRERYQPVPIYWDAAGRFWRINEDLVNRNTTQEIDELLLKTRDTDVETSARLRFEDLQGKIDLAFLTTHGKYGDDGVLQGLLEWLSIPHTGADTLGAALGMDKWMQRKLLRLRHIPMPCYEVITADEWRKDVARCWKKVMEKLALPLVVKPTREGSSFGVGVIKKKEDLTDVISEAFQYDRMVLCEEYIAGREFSCIVIEGEDGLPRALPPTETKHKGLLFTYEEKYLPGAAQKETPMGVAEETLQEIQRLSEQTFSALGFKDYARVDGFVVEAGGEEKVLITDPNAAACTGMASSSFTWHQAAEAGMNPTEFLTYIIETTRLRYL